MRGKKAETAKTKKAAPQAETVQTKEKGPGRRRFTASVLRGIWRN